jgi:dolichol-phosphate mannosyltransferase
VILAAIVPLLPEEAYHWNYARHLDWSYYDHPPMIAWAIALGRLLLGDTRLGVRLGPLLFSLGTTILVTKLAQRLYGEAAKRWALLLYAVLPAAFFVGSWGFPDAPLLFFWALTLTWVWRALQTRKAGWWLAAGLALGGGLLSKYTAAFLVPSILLYLVGSKRDRYWLATPWPYLAGASSLLVFIPVLYWNWNHQWVSFHFQSTARLQAANRVSLNNGLHSLLQQWLLLMPLTLPLALSTIRRAARSLQPREQFLFWTFSPMAVFFCLLGFTPSFHLLWPLPAFLSLTVALAGAIVHRTGRVAGFYRACGGWLVGVGAISALVVGVHAAWVLPGVPPLREIYGWDELAHRCRVLQATLPKGSFYMTAGSRSYPSASQLAFHLGAPSQVYGQNLIGREALQYRFWAALGQLEGEDAVVVVEGGDLSGEVREMLTPYFRSVEPAGHRLVPVGRIAPSMSPAVLFTLYLAHGYQRDPEPR